MFLGLIALAVGLNVLTVTTYNRRFNQLDIDIVRIRAASMTKAPQEQTIFAICLLTKDDLGILPEWLAYHYHAVDLKHLVVAVDPSSTTNPKSILNKFAYSLPRLMIDQWSDEDFMPDFFLNGTFDVVPNFMGVELHDRETYGDFVKRKHMGPYKTRDMRLVNNHRYRQTRFISECARHMQRRHPEKQVLLSLLDTDEYLVVNPLMIESQFEFGRIDGPSWHQFKAGSVLSWLLESSILSSPTCIQVPRLLFGSVERNTTDDTTLGFTQIRGDENVELTYSLPRSSSPFETLRWKYHAAWNDTNRNFQQKVILNLHHIPAKDEIFGDHINSVHRPSRQLCPPESGLGEAFATSPVAAFHYIGSEERYFARPNDLRRNKKRYRERSNLTFAAEPGWIDQWLHGFVQTVGMETATDLLQNYVVQVDNL